MSTKPEMDIFDRIALGLEPAPQVQTNPAKELIGYALSRHVPAMRGGFVVITKYGPWHVGGLVAQRMAEVMRQALTQELAELEKVE